METSQGKLLILSSRYPLPLEKGDKLRIYHQLEHFARRYQIVLVSLVHQPIESEHKAVLADICARVVEIPIKKSSALVQAFKGVLKGLPATVGYFYREQIKDCIHDVISEENPDHIYCQLIRMALYLEGIDIPKSIDYMDCFSLRAQRRSNSSSWYSAGFWRRETAALRQLERETYRWFQQHFIISQVDGNELEKLGVHQLQLLPNGVDTDFFKPSGSIDVDFDVVFIGNLSYRPNVEAASYLVRKIAPILWRSNPQIRILISGAQPTREVQKLKSKQVEVSAFVPDIRKQYQRSRILVAPMLTGSGLQNKILEAMALGLPCITTEIVQDSIAGSAGIVLTASGADDFAQKIIELLGDETRQQFLGQRGREVTLKHYSWSAICDQIHFIERDQKLGQRLSSDS